MTYEDEINTWRNQIDASLRAENSWLALAGLYWFQEGANSFGPDPQHDILLPPGADPGLEGVFYLSAGEVQMEIRGSVPVEIDGQLVKSACLPADTSGKAPLVSAGPLTWMVIERDGQYGLRLWDNNRPERLDFPGRAWYPIDPGFRLEARFQPAAAESEIRLERTIGSELITELGGGVRFTWRDREHELLALNLENGGLFILFKDLTSGFETYPAGRYLTTGPPDEHNHVILDFNRAYHPPCAYTPYATCALPPAQNHLPFHVEAGERLKID